MVLRIHDYLINSVYVGANRSAISRSAISQSDRSVAELRFWICFIFWLMFSCQALVLLFSANVCYAYRQLL